LTFQLKRSKEYTKAYTPLPNNQSKIKLKGGRGGRAENKINMIVVIIHVLGGIEARKNTLSEKKKKKLDYFVDTTT